MRHPSDRDALREWRRAKTIRLLQVAVNPDLLFQTCREWSVPPAPKGLVALEEAISNYPQYETPKKLEIAVEIATRIASSGRKVIVWSTFIHNLKTAASMLKDFGPVVIFGDVPAASSDPQELSREKLIRRFRLDPECRVLVANPAACAESISLHDVCHDAVYLDRSFNCAHYLQSLDRIHRLGLSPDCKTTYYLLLSANSLDEVVHRRLGEKARQMNDVIEGELPGRVPGYWSQDLGDEEEVDWAAVQSHIAQFGAIRGLRATD